ncbi:Plasmodium exported protein, unknown function, partial [Plasmodium vivax]
FQCHLGKDLEKKFKHDRSSNIIFNRSLAKHEYKEELDDLKLEENLVDYERPSNIKNEEHVTSTYAHLKKRRPINMLSYKKDYQRRYYKKKGLAKLDCYCENKLFRRIDELYKLADSMKNDKRPFRKALIKKYRVHICFTMFFYILGALICISDCIIKNHGKGINGAIYKQIKHFIQTIGDIFVYVFPTILLLLTIYISIKYLQYESIKAGRGKMNKKDYFKYCKEVFNLKK